MVKSDSRKRVGILGGTFDPPHKGHILIAKAACTQLALNQMLFIPSKAPPHKNRPDIIDVELRYQMVALALRGSPDFGLSRIEIEKRGVSYSVETLKVLREHSPGTQFYFIVGSDAIPELKTWKNIDEIFSLCKFAVAMRPGFKNHQVPEGMVSLKGEFPNISSSLIRQMVRKGESVGHLIGHAVEEFIKEKGLYK